MTTPATGPTAPQHPELNKLFHKHLDAGDHIRYADETKLIVWHDNSQPGCLGVLTLIFLAIITIGIWLIILFMLGGLSNKGELITYTLNKRGKVKKSIQYGVKK